MLNSVLLFGFHFSNIITDVAHPMFLVLQIGDICVHSQKVLCDFNALFSGGK